MRRKLYHGSVEIIEKPLYGHGKPYNDYGLGFYCTENLDLAKEWGVSKDRDGYANAYELELDGLWVLNLNAPEFCTLHWLAVLLENREFDVHSALALEAKEYLLEHFRIPSEEYDVLTGYRADDSYFSFAQDFISGAISYRQLGNAMRLGKLGEQVVLKSRRAFEQLRFTDYEVASRMEWYEKKRKRDTLARREYFEGERGRRQRGDLYITQILDEEMRADDLRLR